MQQAGGGQAKAKQQKAQVTALHHTVNPYESSCALPSSQRATFLHFYFSAMSDLHSPD